MGQVLMLDPNLDLKAAAPLKAALLERRDGPLTLDASAVERLGGQCLQVLLAARRDWADEGRALTIAPRSAAFEATLELFGAAQRFDGARTAEAS